MPEYVGYAKGKVVKSKPTKSGAKEKKPVMPPAPKKKKK